MILFRLKSEYYKILKYRYLLSSKEFFMYVGDLGRMTDTVDLSVEEIIEDVQNGKTAIFPISASQRMDVVDGHANLGMDIYFMRARDFNNFKAYYTDRCINIPSRARELKQGKLF